MKTLLSPVDDHRSVGVIELKRTLGICASINSTNGFNKDQPSLNFKHGVTLRLTWDENSTQLYPT